MINGWQIRNYAKHWLTAKRKGHGIHSPFVYDLIENVLSSKLQFYAFEGLETLRRSFLKNNTELSINDLGAGSKKLNTKNRKIGAIAKHGISSARQSQIYFKLINYAKSETIIELGTSIGLNAIYFSKANPKAKIYTIEGDEQLYDFSKNLFKGNNCTNIESILGNFDVVLPQIFKNIHSFDLFYIDGNHTYEATLNYFKMALLKRNKGSIIIIDDIYWSKEMTKAWEQIKRDEEVKLTIDCFYFGLIFFKEEIKQKEHFKLFV